MKISVKPMSMNEAYNGQRTKSKAYRTYKTACMIKLKPMIVPDGNLEVQMQIGVSNRGFDIDNAVKPFLDILQEKYSFNDNRVYHLCVYKRIVPKGDEYISFDIFEITE